MRRIHHAVLAVTAAALLAGCEAGALRPSAGPVAPRAQATPDGTYLQELAVKGADGADYGSADREALEWLKKYSRVVVQLRHAQQKQRDLQESNRKLLGRQARLRTEKVAVQGHITQAEATLKELNRELATWKDQVLGMREDLRRDEVQQLRRLQQILDALNGNMPAPRPAGARAAKGEKELTRAAAK